jgi:farnesyl-diphosphate farnesyltransferase
MKDWRIGDEYYQEQILRRVSRSFALTIPQLPVRLRTPVANAYLLCRVADTIEDESALSTAATLACLRRFVAVLRGEDEPAGLVGELLPQLSRRTSEAERELVRNMERIIRVNARLQSSQRCAIERCVGVMCEGMHRFQRTANILKDIWEDRSQGACWLPQDIFSRHEIDVAALSPLYRDSEFALALSELIGVTHAHLRNALSYTLLIPAEESGIRRFCLWAIGLALLTLRNLQRRPHFTSGEQVKVSHGDVFETQLLSSASVRHDWILIRLFLWAAHGLPLASVETVRRSSPANHARDSEAFASLGQIR